MEFTWWTVFSQAAKEAGFGPVTTLIMGIGIAVLMYLGKILKGIRSGYGTILQDQKDATDALRAQIQAEREERNALFKEVNHLRSTQVKILKALTAAETSLSAHGIEVPTAVIETLQEMRSGDDVETDGPAEAVALAGA